VRAEAHRQRGGAGIGRQLQVVRGVAHHQGGVGRHAHLVHQLVQHLRVRLAGGLVGGAGGLEQVGQADLRQRLVQAAPALARGHRQPVAARAQVLQQLGHAGEQGHGVRDAK
jgi:hypothetical protein